MTDAFRTMLAEAVGPERAQTVLSALAGPSSVSLRLHPGKPFQPVPEGEPVPWSPQGRLLPERPSFTLDPFFHAGAYYVQDSSAMFVGEVFRRFLPRTGRPLRVLDLCAAPGGKTTDMAASLRAACGDAFLLVANEVMRARAGVLSDNVALWGDENVVVTSVDPGAFAALEGFFDVIVADVPCSGEGMFRKDAQAEREWSPRTVDLCEARQRRILADVWPALAPDGVLIYSTCTFNVRENGGNVRWAADSLGAEVLPPVEDYPGPLSDGLGVRLLPGLVPGEGQYCAALRKCGGRPWRLRTEKPRPGGNFQRLFSRPMTFSRRGDTWVAEPSGLAAELAAVRFLRPLRTGIAVGVEKGRDLVPDADLALGLALAPDAFPRVEVDRRTALAFLHKDALTLPQAPLGLVLLCHGGLPLGFVKNLGNRCNNLLPAGRRIRMDL